MQFRHIIVKLNLDKRARDIEVYDHDRNCIIKGKCAFCKTCYDFRKVEDVEYGKDGIIRIQIEGGSKC